MEEEDVLFGPSLIGIYTSGIDCDIGTVGLTSGDELMLGAKVFDMHRPGSLGFISRGRI